MAASAPYGRRVRIDLNADLGEGFGVWSLGDDDALLGIVSSANVACGFHAGDPSIIARVCRTAAHRGVTVGAQVSYRDLIGFGRRALPMDPSDLVSDITYQIGAVWALAQAAGTSLRYVKPHGALYNTAAVDESVADAVARAVAQAPIDGALLPILCLPGSVLARVASARGLIVVAEAFADRAYSPDGMLVPRSEPGAVIHDPAAVVARCLRLAAGDGIVAVDGTVLSVQAASICLHGDTPGAVQLGERVRAALQAAGVTIAPFAPGRG
ncbi:MAG: uncharacterized protein JWN20_1598 [Jatrophihabitantaceae bacterium]|nr:uncharacterized protein [Jatrophihabitantaceae bacterium]